MSGQSLEQFLLTEALAADSISLPQLANDFLAEMRSGLEGRPSSLAMLPTYIKIAPIPQRESLVLALDAGGTNFRAALCRFGSNTGPVLEDFVTMAMPGTRKQVSAHDFFDSIAAFIIKHAAHCNKIGFCFSYPAEIDASRDGRLLHFSKEVKAPEVTGMLIGKNLLAALERRGAEAGKKMVIINDSVATLLAGRAQSDPSMRKAFIGMIVGTGLNFAYAEQSALITKLSTKDKPGLHIINTEAGNFCHLVQGPADRKCTAKTANPEKYLLEKMVSGAYLGQLFSQLLSHAADAALIGHPTLAKLLGNGPLDTRSINDFLPNAAMTSQDSTKAMGISHEEAQVISAIATAVVNRAAALVAGALAALCTRSRIEVGQGMCVVADGSTFYGLGGMKEAVALNLNKYLINNNMNECRFARIDNAPLLGAAIAAVTNLE